MGVVAIGQFSCPRGPKAPTSMPLGTRSCGQAAVAGATLRPGARAAPRLVGRTCGRMPQKKWLRTLVHKVHTQGSVTAETVGSPAGHKVLRERPSLPAVNRAGANRSIASITVFHRPAYTAACEFGEITLKNIERACPKALPATVVLTPLSWQVADTPERVPARIPETPAWLRRETLKRRGSHAGRQL